MRKSYFFIFLYLIAFSVSVFAQDQQLPERKQPRILILLDESSSMVDIWENGKPRYKAADEIILKIMDSITHVNSEAEFALRVFGHQHRVQEHNCEDTKLEVPFSLDNYTQMSLRLASIHPLGVTPIAYSLQQAAENDLVDEDKYAYSIILITDGGESCGGDICKVVQELLSKKIYFKPYIVSMVDYAPLRDEYKCLGKYLQVTSEKQVPNTIDSILEGFRPALTLTTAQYKKYLTTKQMPPEVKKVTVPVPKVEEPEKKVIVIKDITPKTIKPTTAVNTFKNNESVATTPVAVKVPEPEKPKPELPKQPPLVVIKHDRYINQVPLEYATKALFPIRVPDFIPLPPEPEEAPPIAVAPPPPPSKPKPKPTPPPKHAVTTTVVLPVTKDKPRPMQYSVVTEDAKETTVEVYFEDGQGHIYHTTPQLNFLDPRTGNTMTSIWRTVDAAGNPDPQNIPAGTYNISVTNSKDMAYNVKVEPNKRNKIILKVHNATLSFKYFTNPNRPMKEFQALVTHRVFGGQQVLQKCTQRLEYEPGNYHISINTLPPSERNTDLDIGDETVIQLPEPGWVQFTNTNELGTAILYYELGDRFVRFYTIKISGQPASQKVQLQPDFKYQIRFLSNPKLNYASQKTIPFSVKSNQVTELELK